MSVFNRMPGWARTYCVAMVVIGLFSAILFGGRILLDGTIFEHKEEFKQVVKIEEKATTTATAQAPVEEDLSAYIADASKGKRISAKCKACHTFDAGGKNKTGPAMWGIFGQEIAAADGFDANGFVAVRPARVRVMQSLPRFALLDQNGKTFQMCTL